MVLREMSVQLQHCNLQIAKDAVLFIVGVARDGLSLTGETKVPASVADDSINISQVALAMLQREIQRTSNVVLGRFIRKQLQMLAEQPTDIGREAKAVLSQTVDFMSQRTGSLARSRLLGGKLALDGKKFH